MTREEKIAARLCDDAELLQEMGYEVMAVFLQGSQNYCLDYEGSVLHTFTNAVSLEAAPYVCIAARNAFTNSSRWSG